jgi:hypothetical protein
MRAKLRVLTGTPVHPSGGERLSPSQLNSGGMTDPSVKALLVRRRVELPESSRGAVMVPPKYIGIPAARM